MLMMNAQKRLAGKQRRFAREFIHMHACSRFFLMGEARPCGSGVCSPPKLKCGKNGVDVAARKQDLRFFIHSVISW